MAGPFWRYVRIWEDNIEMGLKVIRLKALKSIHLIPDIVNLTVFFSEHGDDFRGSAVAKNFATKGIAVFNRALMPYDLCKILKKILVKFSSVLFLIGIVGSGVQLGQLGTAATNNMPIVPAPGDYDGEIGGMIGRGNGSTRRTPLLQCRFVHHKPSYMLEPRKPAINRLSYGTASVLLYYGTNPDSLMNSFKPFSRYMTPL
jgi:hypothetical protein